jgi:hypothetical protein
MPKYKDYHKVLEIDREAGPVEIKQAYRNMAKKFHPDINDSEDAHQRFIEITEAYEILMNRDLHEYYVHREKGTDSAFMRAHYEKARREARESAQRYSKMKYEKFMQEQEAFRKSGWHDLILTLRYILRILAFPVIAIFVALPLISDEVSEHPSGYVMFWLFALIVAIFIMYNWKNYLRIDSYYYHLSDLGKVWKESSKTTETECYYCPGQKAMVYPYKITLFKILSMQIQTFGALYGRKAGSRREQKIVRIPRSRRAFIIHSLSSVIKISILVLSIVFITNIPFARFSLPIGLILGGLISGILLLATGTRPKVAYLISYGMLIKFFVWMVLIGFFGSYAFIFLFFDPMLEALLRLLSKDNLFIPLTRQYPPLHKLFRKQYQLYMELPVLSIISPLFRWLF